MLVLAALSPLVWFLLIVAASSFRRETVETYCQSTARALAAELERAKGRGDPPERIKLLEDALKFYADKTIQGH